MSDLFADIMKNGALDSLTADQLDELILRAQAIRSEQQGTKDVEYSKVCQNCGSLRTKKHGTTSKGSIRMICKDCEKTFTLAEDADTRLTKSQMSALMTGIIDNLSISKLAEQMGVTRSTAHRHKIQIGDILYQKMAENLGAVDDKGKPLLSFEGITQCDEWYCTVSFKGKRDPEFFIWKLKRFPRHNMTMAEQDEYLKKHGLWEKVTAIPGYLQELRDNTKVRKRGISNDQVCIVVAVDDERQIIAKPVSVGRLESTDAHKLLAGRFDDNTTLVTDSHGSYPSLAKSENIRHVQIESGKHSNGIFNLGEVNGIHSQIEKMLPESAERLPATKYLNQYMALFIWLWQHKGLPLADKVLLLKRTIADSIEYKENYDKIKVRPLDINTKGEFPNVV
ncbi:MAG: IS1595 family transposase [Oscillospiraceae bacterium]|nr:IS1595 family transposase [Oscillospiraceae bacterium]